MMLSRRAMLGGAGAALASLPARAAPMPTLRLTAGRLTQGGWATGQVSGEVRALTLDGAAVPIGAGGFFFIGFDRDAGPAARLSTAMANGLGFAQTLTIAPRQWQIESIGAPFHPGNLPDEEFKRRRAAELARINAARHLSTGAEGWRQNFRWPAKGRISGLFGAQRVYRGADGKPQPGAYHPGIDIAVPTGTPYAAPADGVVILAAEAPFTLEGNLLMVDHGMGLNSAFLHGSKLLVREGQSVAQGQVLGLVGMTGRATGPHLHWALKWHEARLDPLLFAGTPM